MSGLRELKKRQTRETIASTAAVLFRSRGFVEDVAQAAMVSRQTVFNYFPTKEAMVFDRDAEIEAALVAAVRERAPETSLAAAFHAHTRAFWHRLQRTLEEGPLPHGFWELIRESPSLLDYAEVMSARHARSVGAELAAQRGLPASDPVCQGLARALCGANSVLLGYGLERLASGAEPQAAIADTLAHAEDLYCRLERGLGS
jgi:AcrR family transcriptional regulator